MALTIAEAKEYAAERYFKIEDANIGYEREFRWGKDVSVEDAKREMKLLCESDIAALQPTTLADEGDPL